MTTSASTTAGGDPGATSLICVGPVLLRSTRGDRRRRAVPLAPRAPPQARPARGLTSPRARRRSRGDARRPPRRADPRRAVIAAYARMERALGAYGLPRHPSEAPDEYLQRIFADLDVCRLSTSRLTALFSWAKFSGHDVAPEMKQEAIEALEAVLEELRAAEILAEHERLAARQPSAVNARCARDAWRVGRHPAAPAANAGAARRAAHRPAAGHPRDSRVAAARSRTGVPGVLAAGADAVSPHSVAVRPSLRRRQVSTERPGSLNRLEREVSMAGRQPSTCISASAP